METEFSCVYISFLWRGRGIICMLIYFHVNWGKLLCELTVIIPVPIKRVLSGSKELFSGLRLSYNVASDHDSYFWPLCADTNWHTHQTLATFWIPWLEITTNCSWLKGLSWWVLKNSLEHSKKTIHISVLPMTRRRTPSYGKCQSLPWMKMASKHFESCSLLHIRGFCVCSKYLFSARKSTWLSFLVTFSHWIGFLECWLEKWCIYVPDD